MTKFRVLCVLREQLIVIAVIMCDMNCTVKFYQRSEVKVVMHSLAQHKTKVVIQCSVHKIETIGIPVFTCVRTHKSMLILLAASVTITHQCILF
jgi:hypothetical protein